ncbi:hypothetical protein N8904_01185 [Flavobacteriales bacterium]|jgi:hypothetical protein|nr:hypothetical protein [Flavobacteriales bacterium]MDA7794388.1 hypothetical protein [Flavobacteriales bacterium]
MKYFVILLLLSNIVSFAQVSDESSLINIHAIDNLSDTSLITSPIEGSLVYVRSEKATYQKYSNSWRPWWDIAVSTTDTLNVIINSFADTSSCCDLYQHVDCGTATTCIGDTLNCGIVVDFNSSVAIVMAPDEYELVHYSPRHEFLGVDVNQPNFFSTSTPQLNTTAGLLAYEYEPDGCQTGQQWGLPNDTMALAMAANLNIINPILDIMNKVKIFEGNEYWLIREVNMGLTEFIQIGANGGTVKMGRKTFERMVRPFAVVPI